MPEELHTNILARNRKNKKLLQNLKMLDGLAVCFDSEESDEPKTFLDKMKLPEEHNTTMTGKPAHIDRLFAHEDEYLE